MKNDVASMSLLDLKTTNFSGFISEQPENWYAFLALVLLYGLFILLYCKVKQKKHPVEMKSGRLQILSTLQIGRKERLLEISTHSGSVLMLLSDQGVALSVLPISKPATPVFNEILEKKYRIA